MSPFRAIVYPDNDKKALRIFISMRSVDNLGHSTVYVLERPTLKPVADMDVNEMRAYAHHVTGTKNSVIHAVYDVDKLPNGKYTLIDRDGHRDLGLNERVLSDCLRIAMSDYCYANHLELLTIL